MARKQNQWIKVSEILERLDTTKKFPIIKPDCLIHGLIEMEKAYLHIHLRNFDQAFQHLQIAKTIITHRYGILHPFSLPIYELLQALLEPDKIQERQQYQDHITRIRQLFSEIKWQGALNSHLLDYSNS